MQVVVDVRPIMEFMQAHYSTEKLCALLAHCEDGNFYFFSCCCFIGAATADHALHGLDLDCGTTRHYIEAKRLEGAENAEIIARVLGTQNGTSNFDNPQLRQRLIPLIRWELRRRERESLYAPSPEVSALSGGAYSA